MCCCESLKFVSRSFRCLSGLCLSVVFVVLLITFRFYRILAAVLYCLRRLQNEKV